MSKRHKRNENDRDHGSPAATGQVHAAGRATTPTRSTPQPLDPDRISGSKETEEITTVQRFLAIHCTGKKNSDGKRGRSDEVHWTEDRDTIQHRGLIDNGGYAEVHRVDLFLKHR
jgi:hypothetical protein